MKIAAAALLLLAASVPLRADDLESRLEAIARRHEATVGVAALDSLTGRKLSIRGSEWFPMGSVYKLPIVMTVLRRASTNDLSLDTEITIDKFSPGHSPLAESSKGQPVKMPIGEAVVRALRDSDNSASDALLGVLGGPKAVEDYFRFVGVTGLDVSRTEREIAADIHEKGEAAYWKDHRDSATPDGLMLLLRMYDEKAHGLNGMSQQFIQDLMVHTDDPSRIRAGFPAEGWKILTKPGTMPGVVNDVAIARADDERHRFIIVVLTKGWTKTPEKDREALIAEISRTIYDEFMKR